MKTVDFVRNVFRERLPRAVPDYEFRPGQLEMAEAVARALETGRTLLVEAGTGIGKSLAYLVPSVHWAVSCGGGGQGCSPEAVDGKDAPSRRRVLVSTGTITLQQQLLNKDIPFLKEVLGLSFRSALAKGKGNYLCKARLEQEVVQPSFAELGVGVELERVLSYVRSGFTGDRAEFDFEPGQVWAHINVDDTCTGSRCRFFEGCYYFLARQALEEAEIIVCNHALALSDLRVRLESGGSASVLPEADALVFDEAHNLPEAAMRAMGIEISEERLMHLTSLVRRSTYFQGLAPAKMVAIQKRLEMIEEVGRRLFSEAMEPSTRGESQGTTAEDSPEARAGASASPGAGVSGAPSFRIPRERVAAVERHGHSLADLLRTVASILDPVPDVEYESLPEELARIRRLSEMAGRLANEMELVTAGVSDDGGREKRRGVSWVEVRRHPVLHWTPLTVDEFTGPVWFTGKSPAVLTSATLCVGGTFTHLKRGLGIPDAAEIVVESPFDYENQCVLYVPVHLPEPGDRRFGEAMRAEIETVLRWTEGRAFVLSTSLQGTEQISEYLRSRLPWRVLTQGEKPKQRLLEEFREDVHSVLVGSLSFWEGVDIQGESLSCVVIDKLPFMVPNDPVVEARAGELARRGLSPFMSMFLPDAVMTLRQGFGRLIRSQTDMGVVAVLDKRILTKRYGRWFVESLPKCRLVTTRDELRTYVDAVRSRTAPP